MKYLSLLLCLSLFFVSCKNEEAKERIQKSTVNIEFKSVDSVNLSGGQLLRKQDFSGDFIKPRPVDVWLPDNYSTNKKYSVLYMHDGQMLFDSTTTWNKQEWKVDEWASKLMKDGKTKDFIVVAIHNISEIRWQDLFPQKAFDYLDDAAQDSIADISGNEDFVLNGDNYLKFLVEELKPKIDSQFSVHTDKAHTFVMGSSMGGLMSMYAISEYPNVFGGAACISTHWPGARPVDNNPFPDAIFQYMNKQFPESGHRKVYFDYGNKTLDQFYPEHAPRVDSILKAKGYTDKDSRNLLFENTDHSENSWNQRLDIPITFLLGK